ncbi:MAG: hypothetical protein RSB61_04505 [Clostridia bacterium]
MQKENAKRGSGDERKRKKVNAKNAKTTLKFHVERAPAQGAKTRGKITKNTSVQIW